MGRKKDNELWFVSISKDWQQTFIWRVSFNNYIPSCGIARSGVWRGSEEGLLLVSSVAQSCLTLCNPMDCNTLGFPVSLSPTPGACSNSCSSSWWCHPTISSSVIPFFSCLQSFPASGSFPTSQFFAWGGQIIGVSSSASVLPMNIPSFRIEWFDLLAVQGTLKSLLQHKNSKASVLQRSAFFMVQSHIHTWLLEKTITWTNHPLLAN